MGKVARFFANWTIAFQRFPVAHLLLAFLALIGILSVYWDFGNYEELFRNLAFGGGLALLVSLFGPLYSLHLPHITKKSRRIARGIQLFALLAGAAYFLIWEKFGNPYFYSEALERLGILLLLMLGIFSLIACQFRKQESKTWFSWTSVLQSVVFGFLAGLIVWGGLSGALASIEALFDVDFSRKWYPYFGFFSMVFLAGSFILNHYVFTISRLPKDLETDVEIGVSRTRKVFGSYIFLPLAMLYLAIFLAYGAKILITGIRPKGIIVWLGTGYFVLGMITFYLTFLESSKIFKRIHKGLFVSFLLILLMMISAIGQRIAQYGITINRYLVCMLILAIGITSLSALIFPKKRLSLLIWIFLGLAGISLYGPLSANNISLSAQTIDVKMLLMKENIYLPLGSGVLINLTGASFETLAYPSTDKYSNQALLEYFIETYPFEEWSKGIIASDFTFSTGNLSSRAQKQELYRYLGLPEKRPEVQIKENDAYFSYYAKEQFPIDIQGYRQIYRLDQKESGMNALIYELSDEDGQRQRGTLDLTSYIESIGALDDAAELKKPYIIEKEGKKFILNSISGEKKDGKLTVTYVEGYVVVK